MAQPSPPYVSGITLRNFRGFRRKTRVALAPLTFIVGPNSAGKSSIFDALLMVAQSNFMAPYEFSLIPVWIGALVDLGSFKDVVYGHNDKLPIEICLELMISSRYQLDRPTSSNAYPIDLSYRFKCSKADHLGKLSTVIVKDITSGESLHIRYYGKKTVRVVVSAFDKRNPLTFRQTTGGFDYRRVTSNIQKFIRKQLNSRRFNRAAWERIGSLINSPLIAWFLEQTQRVSSGRAKPRRWYDVTGTQSWQLLDEVTPRTLERTSEEFRRFRSRVRIGAKKNIPRILRKMQFAKDIKVTRLSAYHSSIDIKDDATAITSKLIDVGFGISQALPVIEACLTETTSPLCVEQPEVHLHPKAQGHLAELLAETSQHRQVIVETHSVHMINRARMLIARDKLSPKDVVVNYVYKDKEGSHVQRIGVDEFGSFTGKWPEGFFDERYEDTMALLRLKTLKKNPS